MGFLTCRAGKTHPHQPLAGPLKPRMYNYRSGRLFQADNVQLLAWPGPLQPIVYDCRFGGDSHTANAAVLAPFKLGM